MNLTREPQRSMLQSSRDSRRVWQGYLVAATAVAIIAVLRWQLQPILTANGTYLFFIVPVVVAGWYGGLWPAMAATLLGGLVISFFFLTPGFRLPPGDPTDYLRLLAFTIIGSMVALLTETLHRSRAAVEMAARRVAEGERHLRFALQAGRMGSWEWDMRTNAVQWSENLEEIQGLPPGSFDGTYEGFLDLVHPDDRQRLQEAIRSAVGEQGHYDLEYRVCRPGGEVGWMRGTGRVVRDEAGPLRMIGLGIDITEQKTAEEAARRLASIVESSNDAIVGKDLEGRITSWNRGAEHLYGYTAEEVIGRPSTILSPEEGEEGVARILRAIAVGERIETVETVRVTKSGRRIDVSVAVSPMRDRDGRLVGASVIARDVTERKRMEAELRSANQQLQLQAKELGEQYENMQAQNAELAELDRQRNEFLAMLGHELRNPLASILATAELLRAAPAAGPSREQIEAIGRQTRHLVRIVDDLLDASRISQGKIELRRGRHDLAALIEQSVQIAQPLITERRHSLTVSLPPAPVVLDVDATRFVQVICNILNNAAKYTEAGGDIRVAAAREGEEAVVRVSDSGRGIAPEVLPRVFDLFVQGERTLARSEGGLGVGLCLVRRLVELHGGTVEARSEGVGKGTEFAIRIPALPAKAADSAPTMPTPEPLVRVGGSGRRVLLIDDNGAANEALAELLELWGHEVYTAATGADGLRMAEAKQPEVILLDIGLPDMDGYEVARVLRTRPEASGTRIVAVSGYGQPSDRRQAIENGFDAHLVKPVEPAVIRELLETA